MSQWRGGHRVDYTVSEYGVRLSFECEEEDPRSWCRKVCSQDCEEWTSDHETETGHAWAYRSECNVETWLENSDPFDVYEGRDAPARSGPIQVCWECGAGYVWRQDPDYRTPAEELRLLRETVRAVVIELAPTSEPM